MKSIAVIGKASKETLGAYTNPLQLDGTGQKVACPTDPNLQRVRTWLVAINITPCAPDDN